MEVDPKVLEGMVDFVEAAVGYAQKQAELEKAAAERAPAVVEALVKAGMVQEERRKAAEAAAQDPLKVLDSLKKTAEAAQRLKHEGAPPPALGRGEELDKTASYESRGSALDGESNSLKQANDRFMSALGLGHRRF
jgi:hypothetical protein